MLRQITNDAQGDAVSHTDTTTSFKDLWDLAGNTFIVFGAGNGIGVETSRALQELGANVVCVDRDADLAEKISGEVGGHAVTADAATEEGVNSAIEAAIETYGQVDGAVDIIGQGLRTLIDDLTPDRWDAEWNRNMRHAYLIGHLLGPRLARNGGGSLTFVASVSAGFGSHVQPAYVAAKAAMLSWVKSLAITYGPYGVRVNSVSPGTTTTPRMTGLMDADGLKAWTACTALKELNTPADIAAAAAFLMSPLARTVSGHDLVVDGAMSARDPYYGDVLDSHFAEDLNPNK
jgi:NAD(P)-dependent dehydrogenase (short-subunit alcohol dehydrogenase family)